MKISTQSRKGNAFLSGYETIQVMIAFGTYTIGLIGLVVVLLKNDKKK